jgi:carbamoyl-phosphate synthase small subunit
MVFKLNTKKAYVILEDGQVFEGYLLGCEKDVIGEAVFTTGMTGYIETLTDPSYYGQIIIQTFPLIGNYGVMKSDAESRSGRVSAFGYIVRGEVRHALQLPQRGRYRQLLERAGYSGGLWH